MGVMEEYVLGNRKRPTTLALVEKRKRRYKLHFLSPAMDRSQERLGFLHKQKCDRCQVVAAVLEHDTGLARLGASPPPSSPATLSGGTAPAEAVEGGRGKITQSPYNLLEYALLSLLHLQPTP